ncbi:MAG: ATP phosphoribosyltransferase regulatory subunit, partial [Planctomycetota bacterium]
RNLASEVMFRVDEYDTACDALLTSWLTEGDAGSRLAKPAHYEVDRIDTTTDERIWIDGKNASQARVPFRHVCRLLSERGLREYCTVDFGTVRGLAYYTGTVFELIADGERAVAGGGRYDNLIELFGGPPTPAVGFGMGDVVLSLLLEDKGLMPEGAELREAVSQPAVSVRPEAFVIADEDQAELVEPLLASLRRGVQDRSHDESRPWASDRYFIRPLHARRSYRAKRKKQMQDASAQFAQFAVTVNEPDKVELRDMDNPGDDLTPNCIDAFSKDVRSSFADFSVDPDSPVYVGKAIASLLG